MSTFKKVDCVDPITGIVQSLGVVVRATPDRPFIPPLVVIAVEGTAGSICESCALKSECDSLFGPRGQTCEIHVKGERWERINSNTLEVLKKVLK